MQNDPHALDLRLPIDYLRRIDSAAQREGKDRATWLSSSIERALEASEREHRESVEHAAWLAFVLPSDGDSLGSPLVSTEERLQPEPDEPPDPDLACPGCGDTESPHLSLCDGCVTGYLHEVDDGFSCCRCGAVTMGAVGSDVSIEEALDQAAYEDWRQFGDPADSDLL